MKKRTTYSAMICRILSMPCLRKSSALGILPHHMIPLFQIGRSIHCCSSFHGSHDSVIPHASSAFRKPFYKGRKKITKIHLRGPLYRLNPQNFLTQPLPHALRNSRPKRCPTALTAPSVFTSRNKTRPAPRTRPCPLLRLPRPATLRHPTILPGIHRTKQNHTPQQQKKGADLAICPLKRRLPTLPRVNAVPSA